MMLEIDRLLNHTLLLYPGIFDLLLTDISPTLLYILKPPFTFFISSTKYGLKNRSTVN